jgi:OOP family OmpA-OmpF porin
MSVIALLAGACVPFGTTRVDDCLEPNRRVVVEVGGSTLRPTPKSTPQAKPIRLIARAQGATAFDAGSGTLKESGRAELDALIVEIAKRKVQVGSVVIAGYADRVESERGPASLSEDRAKSVAAYLGARGLEPGLMFWEGKGTADPLPATNFCE